MTRACILSSPPNGSKEPLPDAATATRIDVQPPSIIRCRGDLHKRAAWGARLAGWRAGLRLRQWSRTRVITSSTTMAMDTSTCP